jgi:hypothetical protein
MDMASGQQEHGSEDPRTLKYSLMSPQPPEETVKFAT